MSIPLEVEEFAKARDRARENKDWAESDRLRNLIGASGYKVEDTARGHRLKKL